MHPFFKAGAKLVVFATSQKGNRLILMTGYRLMLLLVMNSENIDAPDPFLIVKQSLNNQIKLNNL